MVAHGGISRAISVDFPRGDGSIEGVEALVLLGS